MPSLLPHDITLATSSRPYFRKFLTTLLSLLPHDSTFVDFSPPFVATSSPLLLLLPHPFCRYFLTPSVATFSPLLVLLPHPLLSLLSHPLLSLPSLLLRDPTVPTPARTDSRYFCSSRNWYSFTEFHDRYTYNVKNVTWARIRTKQHSVWC
jgi:hypothetical protein